MIKLTDLSQQPPITLVFNTDEIIIGSNPSSHDPNYLYINDNNLKEQHIQILFDFSDLKKVFYIINLAQDPFATLNSFPFGKQPLKNKDLIQIGKRTYQVLIEESTPAASKEREAPKENENFLETSLGAEEAQLLAGIEIDKLMRQVEAMKRDISLRDSMRKDERKIADSASEKNAAEMAPRPPSSQPKNDPISKPRLPLFSLKDYYFHENDEEQDVHLNKQQEGIQKESKLELKYPWKAMIKLLAIAASFILISFGFFFIWAEQQTSEEELMAAKGAADVAMALTYTQIKHIRPQNQNWSDPEFIQSNLTSVLASDYKGFAEFDSHGLFSHCPYMLRIYTNSEITRFLVLAQPAPSLLQWLIPKGTIIIDSSTMEMRKVKDLKSLNRLLVNSNSLDGAYGEEITALVQKGDLITLKGLAAFKENEGYIPPKALGFIDPNAENMIYNAPRYYCLSENLIKKSQQFLSQNDEHHDAALLIQEIFALKKLSHLVLYSSGGIQSAIEAQRTLLRLAPKEKFLIAYLHLNSSGKVSSSHLLMDDSSSLVAEAPDESSEHPTAKPIENDMSSDSIAHVITQGDVPLQLSNRGNDPLILKLNEISSFHQNMLQSVTNETISLLKRQVKSSQPNFAAQFTTQQKKIFEINEELKTHTQKKLKKILQEYTLIPAAQFAQFIKDADLENDFEEFLIAQRSTKSYLDSEMIEQQINQELQNIHTSSNWQELDYSVEHTGKLLQFENVPYIEPLIHYQEMMKLAVIKKLNEFFYSTDRGLPDVHFLKQHREYVIKILQNAWIEDFMTVEAYLNEFDKKTIIIVDIAD